LKECLQSISKHTRGVSFEIFVIDNASTDKTVEMLQSLGSLLSYPTFTIISNSENRGFACANNQGIARAKGRYILLLNPDTRLRENSFSTMIAHMDKNPSCGILGCRLCNSDGSDQDSVRRFPRFLDQCLILLKLHHIFLNTPPINRYLCKNFNYAIHQEVDQVMGACFMIRKEVLTLIGPLDEGFFNWFEEVDFCKRTKNAGYTICYTPETTVVHHYGQSFKQVMTINKQIMWNNSVRYYFKKHHKKAAYIAISMVSWVALFVAHLLSVFKRIVISKFAR
jgi:GT2 family glycosyltransferase